MSYTVPLLKHNLNEPSVVWDDGTEFWYQNGKIHRENGPAVITKAGHCSWYRHGSLHRLDGPAILRTDGLIKWFANGHHCRTVNEFRDYSNLSNEEILLLILKYGEIE